MASPHSFSAYRFIRLNPRLDKKETLARLKAEVNRDPYPLHVPWMEGFYALPGDFALHKSSLFETARVYGQDVSSGAAVAALLTDQYDCNRDDDPLKSSFSSETATTRVLDLCCCPGLKMCYIADLLRQERRQAEVVGVDVSEERMAVCKRIVRKYQVAQSCAATEPETYDADSPVRLRLYCNDGTKLRSLDSKTLNLVFDSVVAREDDATRLGKRKRMNKSYQKRERKRLDDCTALDTEIVPVATDDNDSMNDTSSLTLSTGIERLRLFDRVLVDAECSTDGSIVHVQKKRMVKNQQQSAACQSRKCDSATRSSSPWNSVDRRAELLTLQQKLAATGFQLLKKGGTMVYSTCSLEEDQNGGVVRWLLNEFPNASIVPIDFLVKCELKKEGTIPGTVQFVPNVDPSSELVDPDRLCGGGLFLAKIRRS